MNVENPYGLDTEAYKNNSLITQFFQATTSNNKSKEKSVLNNILKNANKKELSAHTRYRILLRQNKMPKMFCMPYFIIDPNIGKAGMFSLCRRQNELDVFQWENANLDLWKKYDRQFYLQMSDNSNYVQNVPFEEVITEGIRSNAALEGIPGFSSEMRSSKFIKKAIS
jgi:hypothetical protein